MLLAYDADGSIIATIDSLVLIRDGQAVGLVDFEAHEASGRPHTEIWHVAGAKGSKVWPEPIGARAHEFRVELSGEPGQRQIAALVHTVTGHRRERVGATGRPVTLDFAGQTTAHGSSPDLPAAGG